MESATRLELHDAIEQLNDEQVEHLLSLVRGFLVEEEDPLRKRLRSIPGIKLPDQWPPRFERFEPLEVEGEPPSEQLIRERR